ncbi:hypothetical protein LIER_39661 [Lithospermum erythrorhizon]|uniref:Reverse transcriptase domain-containing protein n=1 Tax=Lithospermum erythrorhizon TaxID=34254 RepID=A0AAV3QKU7_LITER
MEHVDLLDCIPALVTSEDNVMMLAAPTIEEDLIDDEMVAVVAHFLKGHKLPQAFTSTTIALIPKTEAAKSWKEYRPISLCTYANKIFTRLLSSRLATILPKLISDYQVGFLPG